MPSTGSEVAKRQEGGVDAMQQQADYKAIIKLHKSWADRLMILWFVFVVTLFAGISLLLDESKMDAGVKTNGYILLGVIVIIGTVWQAAGMTIARLHMLMEGIAPPDSKKPKGGHPDVIPGA
jgi:hypothetical protein